MKKLVFIKLGGSSITDVGKENTAKESEIYRLLDEIYSAKKELGFDVVIGHGSGSFGHVPAKKYKVNEGLVNDESRKGAVITKQVAQQLDSILVDIAIRQNIPVMPFAPSSFMMLKNGEIYSVYSEHIAKALELGFIPVVYGDVVIDVEKGVQIASTETVLHALSKSMKPDIVIMDTDVNGIYDKDPVKYKDAKLIRHVDSSNIMQVIDAAGGSNKIDVTGGMKHKLIITYEMIKETKGVGYIANANVPGIIGRILNNDERVECTKIEA
ncbi:MAG: isopentenyl phosphate kinase [Candidatus Micrarchaeia archaeon]